MAELTGDAAKVYTDSELNQTFGQRKPNDVLSSQINWKLPDNTIEYIETSCSTCTKAWYENGQIYMVLDLSKVANYSPGKNSVIKDVFIYLDDGEKRFIPNEKKQKTINAKKKFVRVRLNALVVI